MKAEQPALFHVARQESAFTRETLRRGGPREVMGVRFRGIKAQREAHQKAVESPQSQKLPETVLAAMNWPRRAK